MTLYRTICADPPWPGDWWLHAPGVRRPRVSAPSYSLMTLAEIEAVPVGGISHPDANLFLWVPARLNREGWGVRVARGWGFEPVGEIVWSKPNIGMGRFPRMCHEILLVCSRGGVTLTGPWDVKSVQAWNVRRASGGRKVHSLKPDAALDLIEAHSPGPYVEMFARRHRMNWDVWGLESANTAAMVATP